VLRASAACEQAGIPTVTLVCEGFVSQAKATARGLGLPGMALGVLPGHTGAQTPQVVLDNVRARALGQTVEGLLGTPEDAPAQESEPHPEEIVFSGGFDDVNDHFYRREWGDGLPLVPPTVEKVRRFLRFTDRAPHAVLGVMLPDNRCATPWNIAVNGVMSGCRPEYMPVLVATAQALLDPQYGVEHSGNTPGAETLVVLNGPIAKELGFNCGQGVMRDGPRANTSVGRFVRLYLRNVAGFLPGATDKATFGNTWRVVVAENDDAVRRIGWTPLCADMGFAPSDNVVTIARHTGGNVVVNVDGATPEALLPYIADRMAKEHGYHVCFSAGQGFGALRPMLLLTPVLAETIARAGWSKRDVQQYLFDHARITAREFDRYASTWQGLAHPPLSEWFARGKVPEAFAQSDDPERRVPIVFRPEDFHIVVTGDPLRTNAYIFTHNGLRGFTVAKQIELPAHWPALLHEFT
jgi:hypothetical protein